MKFQTLKVWLGGLFNPEAYVTATRQYVAQANSWSLEELTMEVEIATSSNVEIKGDSCFGITGLKLQGAIARDNRLHLDSTILTELPLVKVSWVKINSPQPSNKVSLPVYLNGNRSELLFTVSLEAADSEVKFFERGVAFIASTAFG